MTPTCCCKPRSFELGLIPTLGPVLGDHDPHDQPAPMSHTASFSRRHIVGTAIGLSGPSSLKGAS